MIRTQPIRSRPFGRNIHYGLALVGLAMALCQSAIADVPVPKPRPRDLGPMRAIPLPPPAPIEKSKEAPPPRLEPTEAARDQIKPHLAAFKPLAPIQGPGECGAEDVVQLEAVTLQDQRRLTFMPAATLRVTMAEALIAWLREDAAPVIREFGPSATAIITDSAYECRGRNRIEGAKMSEHAFANALDIRGFKLASGETLLLTDPAVSKRLRERLRESVCARFTTVLGPGSDGFHEAHIHVDLAPRSGGRRMCQWDIREPRSPD